MTHRITNPLGVVKLYCLIHTCQTGSGYFAPSGTAHLVCTCTASLSVQHRCEPPPPKRSGCCSLSGRSRLSNHVPLLPANSLGCSCAWAGRTKSSKAVAHLCMVGGPLSGDAVA